MFTQNRCEGKKYKEIINFYTKYYIFINLCMDSDKTEFMCFKQDGIMFSLNSKPQKLLDQFLYLSNNISSTESNVNICIDKAWTAFDKLMTIFKSDL